MNAVIALQPCCPQCLQVLPTPEWWTLVTPADRVQPITVACTRCERVVTARFYAEAE